MPANRVAGYVTKLVILSPRGSLVIGVSAMGVKVLAGRPNG